MGGLVDIPLSRLSVVRAGTTGMRFNAAGALEAVAANTARIDFDPVTLACRGMLAEATRTNSIRNPRCEGAIAGTPGTLPTYWSANALPSGLTRSVVGSGTEDGIPYIDIRFQGTATGYTDIVMDSPAAAVGQTATGSVYARLVGGSWSGVSGADLIIYGAPSYSDNAAASLLGVTGAPLRTQRTQATRTFTNGTTTAASVRVTLTAAGAVDVTLRIGLPQYELGAPASSPILPPVGAPAASTRNADWPTVALTSLPGWNAAEWTLVVEHEIIALTSGQVVAGIGSTFGASAYLSYSNAVPLGWGAGYGTSSWPTTAATLGVHRNVLAMGGTTALVSADGAAAATVSGAAPPSGATMLGIGNAPWSASNPVGGYIRRLQYLPRKADAAEVRALSAGTDITGQTVPATGNCLLSWVNLADRAAAVITSASAVDGLGAERLKDPQARRRMRTAVGVTSVALTVDAATVGEIGVVAVLQPDDAGYIDADGDATGFMAASDTIRHRLDAVTPGAGALYDSLYYRDPGYLGATLDLNFTAQSYREFQNDTGSGIVAGYGLHVHVLPAAVEARHWRCDIAAPSLATTPGYLDLGRLWAGPAFRPTRNFAYEWSDSWDDLSDVTEVRRSGQEFVDRGPKRRRLTFAFKALTAEEAKVVMTELGRIAGTSRQVLFIQEPNGPYQGRQAIIGRLVEVSPITQPNFALYERVFQIRQSL
ncbi:phage head spike fiber domain-containing protein [Azospirillum aestuarii]|uniref:phage head spike fiber domain-containing protein n=1 Tax=Azospirillum aestuarii TaxID=2802052 RepID=UPI004054A2B1